MRSSIALLGLLLLSACGAAPEPLHCTPPSKQVGMWYSTWYKASEPKFWGLYNPLQGRYNSSDVQTIDAHIQTLETAGVDFVILDNTNNLHVDGGYILDSSLAFAERLQGHRLQVAVAIGGMQYSHDARTLDRELQEVRSLFVDGPGGGSYLRTAKGPVIVSYAPDGLSDADAQSLTQNHPEVDLRWIHGIAREGELGWANPAGALPDCQAMVAMPGWQNAYGKYVDREGGAFYDRALSAILSVNPAMAVIASFNDFSGENTGVEPTDVYGDTYWKKTIDFIEAYKSQ